MFLNKLRTMIRIRLFEEKVTELKLKGLIKGPVHTCIGQEAVCTGVCLALSHTDYIIGNHRSHGHLIAKGTDVKLLMTQIFKGNGRSMHVNDVSVGAICSTAIVGSGLPLACGMAFASKFKKEKNITCVFFGDGAVNEGTFYESINLASLWKLPVLFILENNGVAVITTLSSVSTNEDLIHRADPFEIIKYQADGQNIDDVYNVTKRAKIRIKIGNCPALIEAKTFRFHEHQEGITYEKMKGTNYRSNEEVSWWHENKDPIQLYSSKLIREKLITQDSIKIIYAEETELINNAVDFALNTSI